MSVLTTYATDEDRSIITAARSLAASFLRDQPGRYRHVEGAARAAAQVVTHLSNLEVSRGRLIAAAWLHDIGYASEVRASGFHPLDGAEFLREGGWDGEVTRLVAHHSHARLLAPYYGVEAHLSRFAPIHGLAADVVTFADVVSGVSGTGVTVADRIAELRARTSADASIPEEVREARYRLLRQSADNVRMGLRRSVRTGD